MKKLKLSISSMKAAEILSREQQKKIIGGSSSGGSGYPKCNCDHDSDCGSNQKCSSALCDGASYIGRCIDNV